MLRFYLFFFFSMFFPECIINELMKVRFIALLCYQMCKLNSGRKMWKWFVGCYFVNDKSVNRLAKFMSKITISLYYVKAYGLCQN